MNTIFSKISLFLIVFGVIACGKDDDTTAKIAIQQISLGAETKLAVGLTAALNPTVFPANVTNAYTLQWTSENPAVATVDDKGVVTAVGKGTTNIRVTVSESGVPIAGIAASTRVVVEDFTISFATPTTNIEIGKTLKLMPAIGPQGFTPTLEWASSNTSVATVTADGTVTARNVGESIITVTIKEQPSVKATITAQVGAGEVNPGAGIGDIPDGGNW